SIGTYAFYNCSSYLTIYYMGTETDWLSSELDDDSDLSYYQKYYSSEWYYNDEGVPTVNA
ncbi:MAG: hypothetical protein IJ393_07070, partial [Clostridia bacterium]|nr:hypothetical protein [Clostridia bacterium]